MNLPVRCRCGRVQGSLGASERAARAICYCRDCQAFARFLGAAERILDAHGGTEVLATNAARLTFARGHEQLRCMSLTDRGLLRWYTACCRTAIGNTPRNPTLGYIGLVNDCLDVPATDMDRAFGPAAAINRNSARGRVASTPWTTFVATVRIIRNIVGARLGGKSHDTPFFDSGTARPVAQPEVVTPDERSRLRQ